MALPSISTPTYEAVVPSTGETVQFRPFLVKEEKILLIAVESKDKKAQIRALKQILKNCIQSKTNINSLAMYDIEYLFIQIRGKAVGEILEPVVVCPQCSVSGKLKIDLSSISVNTNTRKETPYKVMVSDKIGMTFVYPVMEMVENLNIEKTSSGVQTDTEAVFRIIASCIDTIFDEEKVFNPKDYSEKEIMQFLENIPSEPFRRIVEFISSMPRVEKIVHFKCPNCQFEKDMVLRGIEDFFGSVSPTIA